MLAARNGSGTGLALCAVLVGLAACGHERPANDPVPSSNGVVPYEPPPQYPEIAWIGTLEEARARAADEHKPMIVFVRAAWSKPSVVMDTTVWQDARVLAEAGRFVALRVDLTPSYEGLVPDSLKDYDIRSVPTTLIVSSSGQITGRLGVGKATAAEVAKAMHETH
jgi:thiol:disulfide interchange protein